MPPRSAGAYAEQKVRIAILVPNIIAQPRPEIARKMIKTVPEGANPHKKGAKQRTANAEFLFMN